MTKIKGVRPASELDDMEVLPTGILGLDFALRKGGIPLGYQIEIFGRNGTGKSLLSYYLMAEAQRREHKAAYINVEGIFDPSWAKRTSGIKLSDLDYADPPPNSEAIQLLFDLVRSGDYRIIVFDSLGSLVDDTPKEDTDIRVGGTSLMVSNMVQKINKEARINRCTIVYLNQVRAVMNTRFPVEKSPGGNAKDHMMAVRIHLKPGERFTENKEDVGFRIESKIIKNKFATPNKTVGWNIWNEPTEADVVGIDLEQDFIDIAISQNIIKRGGAFYTHALFGEKSIQGRNGVSDFLKENPEAREFIWQEVVNIALDLNKKELGYE